MKYLLEKSQAVRGIYHFFESHGFLYLQNEIIQYAGAMEPYLDAFSIGDGYLSTSPEFFLKKGWGHLVENGLDSGMHGVFTITSSFRDEEISADHRKEFTMVEWYRRTHSYLDLAEDIRGLLEVCGYPVIQLPVLSFPEEVEKISGVFLPPEHGAGDLLEILNTLNQKYGEKVFFPDPFREEIRLVGGGEKEMALKVQLFSLLMDAFLLPMLAQENPLFCINSFPSYTAGMAKIGGEGWANRLEVFLNGLEIANGYDELDKPEEILNRWAMNNKVRILNGKVPHPVDTKVTDYSAHLSGVSGMAAGLERILMAIHGEIIGSYFLD